MIDNMVPVFVVGFIIWGIYRIFELFARRKERMAIIEKLGEKFSSQDVENALNLPLFSKQPNNSSLPLRISLLMIGIGLGLVSAFIIHYAIILNSDLLDLNSDYIRRNLREIEGIIYLSFISVFGGIGLLVAYLIETRKEKKR